MRRITLLLAAALAILALPAAAQASIVEEGPDGNLKLREDGSEINNVSVTDGLAGSSVAIEVRDLTGVTSRTPLCSQVSTIRLRCAIGVRLTRMELGGNNDNFAYGLSDGVVVFGGSGNDGYTGATAPVGSGVVFHGDAGFDAVSYSNADRGVRIRNDAFLSNGRIGLDADTIGSNVEIYEGSPFNDEITDASVSGLPKTIRGRQGDDVLSGARFSGTFTTFDMGGVADGADDVFGGDGFSFIDYSRRRQPLNVTAGFIPNDDGEAGEGDEIVVRDAHITGGQASDVLRSSSVSIQPRGFDGGAGGDRIEGGAVNDNITGGPGVDTLVANGGDDFIVADDGVSDIIGCGAGVDTARVDASDVSSSCETRRVGVLKLGRKALDAKAGKAVPVELSWTHPRSWVQLRSVELRVLDAGVTVGKVKITPRAKRINADGAVELVPNASRLVRQGKTVTARLALRVDEALAGRKLGLEIEAVDVTGARQIER